MGSVDLEYQLEAMYVVALQGIFAFDDKFIYNEDETTSLIAITTDYPDENVPLRLPHIVVTGVNFEFNLDNTMFRNYAGEVYDDNGVYVGQKFLNIVPYNLTLQCLAEFNESKDLANKTTNYISFDASEVFDDMGLHITRVNKGVSVPMQQYPQKIFQTPVSITGSLHWQGIKTRTIDPATVLQKVTSNMQIYLNK